MLLFALFRVPFAIKRMTTPTGITRLKHNANDMETHNLNDVFFQSILFTNSLLKQNKIE